MVKVLYYSRDKQQQTTKTMKATLINEQHETVDSATYKTERGINNFIDKQVYNYNLRLVEKRFENTEYEVQEFKGGAGWKMLITIRR
jgi:hypothetical protein